jgi:hypothetical protein
MLGKVIQRNEQARIELSTVSSVWSIRFTRYPRGNAWQCFKTVDMRAAGLCAVGATPRARHCTKHWNYISFVSYDCKQKEKAKPIVTVFPFPRLQDKMRPSSFVKFALAKNITRFRYGIRKLRRFITKLSHYSPVYRNLDLDNHALRSVRARWLERKMLSRSSSFPVRRFSIQSSVDVTDAKAECMTTVVIRWISSAVAEPAAFLYGSDPVASARNSTAYPSCAAYIDTFLSILWCDCQRQILLLKTNKHQKVKERGPWSRYVLGMRV